PRLPAARRAATAVTTVGHVAQGLGYGAAWERIEAAVRIATDRRLAVSDSCRFWVWSGVDQGVADDGVPEPPALKIYLSLLESEVGGARPRLDRILAAARVPSRVETRAALGMLDEAGFPHEVGFALGPDGRIVAKAYYELHGW